MSEIVSRGTAGKYLSYQKNQTLVSYSYVKVIYTSNSLITGLFTQLYYILLLRIKICNVV